MGEGLEDIRKEVEQWVEQAASKDSITEEERAQIQGLLQKMMDAAWDDSEITNDEQKMIDEVYDAAMEKLRKFEEEEEKDE